MKRVTVCLGMMILILGSWIGKGHAGPEVRIAYVDLQRVIETSEKGKAFRDQLFQFRKEREQILTGKQEEVNRMGQDFQQKSFTLSDRARLDREQELRQKEMELKNLSESYRQEILLEGRKLQTLMFRDLSEIVSQIGKSGGYTMVLDKDTLLWADSAIDITDQVIKAYNASAKTPATEKKK
jgi:outer membrane protein